jgi:tRNA G37 N-methylase TrmD
MLGAGLIIFAVLRLVLGVVGSIQTEQHPMPDGFVIDHLVEIPHTTIAVAVAGAAVFALSFVRRRAST